MQGEEVCETGLGEEPELHWREDQREALAKKMAACERIKSTFQRTAREASDVQFLEVQVRACCRQGAPLRLTHFDAGGGSPTSMHRCAVHPTAPTLVWVEAHSL